MCACVEYGWRGEKRTIDCTQSVRLSLSLLVYLPDRVSIDFSSSELIRLPVFVLLGLLSVNSSDCASAVIEACPSGLRTDLQP